MRAALKSRPGLILADIQLADGSSGLEAVNEILGTQEVPVIFITAFPERFLTGQAPEPAFLITKPFSADLVKAVISQALFFDRKSQRTEAKATSQLSSSRPRNLLSRWTFGESKVRGRGSAVPYYDFCLIGGDGSRLSRERHPAADLETVWGRVFRMAELESKRGKQIHVLDDQGKIVIGIGAIAASLSADRARATRGCCDAA